MNDMKSSKMKDEKNIINITSYLDIILHLIWLMNPSGNKFK